MIEDRNHANLLTPEDLVQIRNIGLPFPPREDLVKFDCSGTPIFSVKGIQFHKAAAASVGLTVDFSALTSVDDFLVLSHKIVSLGLDQVLPMLEEDLRNGRIAPEERDFARALLSGKPEEIIESAKHAVMLSGAGENVVPCIFGRSRSK